MWLVVTGSNEGEVARRLAEVDPVLRNAITNHLLTSFTLPTMLWPNPEAQAANRATVQQLVAMNARCSSRIALAGGFTT